MTRGAIGCQIKTWEYDMAGKAEAAGQLRGEAAGDQEVTRESATGQLLFLEKSRAVPAV